MSKKDITKRKKGEVIYEAKIDGQERKPMDYKIILMVLLFVIVSLIMILD